MAKCTELMLSSDSQPAGIRRRPKPVRLVAIAPGAGEVWHKCRCRRLLRVGRDEAATCVCGERYCCRDSGPARRVVVIEGTDEK